MDAYNKPHLAPRTIREWLDLIPFDRARKEAIILCEKDKPYTGNEKVSSLSTALEGAFCWDEEYWCDLHKKILHMEQSVKLKNNEEPPMMGMSY